jgi:hypothetical protein
MSTTTPRRKAIKKIRRTVAKRETTRETVTSAVESVSLDERKIDRKAGVIYGARILNAESRNGRVYTREAMEGAISKYDRKPVCFDHPSMDKRTQPRSVRESWGEIRNPRVRSFGGQPCIVGDVHYTKTHAATESLLERIERKFAVGLSHNTDVVERVGSDGRRVVERIAEVYGVDIVSRPATTNSVFEHETPRKAKSARKVRKPAVEQDEAPQSPSDLNEAEEAGLDDEGAKDLLAEMREAMLLILDDAELDDASKLSRIRAMLADPEADDEQGEPESDEIHAGGASEAEEPGAMAAALEWIASAGIDLKTLSGALALELIQADDDEAREAIVASIPPAKRGVKPPVVKTAMESQESLATRLGDQPLAIALGVAKKA